VAEIQRRGLDTQPLPWKDALANTVALRLRPGVVGNIIVDDPGRGVERRNDLTDASGM